MIPQLAIDQSPVHSEATSLHPISGLTCALIKSTIKMGYFLHSHGWELLGERKRAGTTHLYFKVIVSSSWWLFCFLLTTIDDQQCGTGPVCEWSLAWVTESMPSHVPALEINKTVSWVCVFVFCCRIDWKPNTLYLKVVHSQMGDCVCFVWVFSAWSTC